MVLVVDDEDAIRSAVSDILELIDVNTVEAADGESAIEIYHQHRETIHLVLLDVNLPGLSGEDVFRALRAVDATLPIVLSSGYDDSDIAVEIRNDPQTSFLRKPYAVDSLIAAVQSPLP